MLVCKVDFNIMIIDYMSVIVAMANKSSDTASSKTTS